MRTHNDKEVRCDNMICPNCQGNISDKRSRCDRCGQDLTIYKKILKSSNLYYNKGLSKAKVRDLSGAIIALRYSLELNKANTNARNLLGLIYFEMGETVAALSEWVISKYFKPEENDADEYINEVQENPTRLDNMNQAIKRYNNALTFAKQGSDDLAIIQLKRVISLNPRFIRAYHLISLLYMKNGENDKAKRNLLKAARIDVSNTTTLKYLKEIEPQNVSLREGEDYSQKDDSNSSILPISSYKEDKPNIIAYVNLIIGVLIGLAVGAILLYPSFKNKDVSDNNQKYVDYSAGLAAIEEKEATITTLQEEKFALEERVVKLQAELDGIELPEHNPRIYDSLFEATNLYIGELVKEEGERELLQLAELLRLIDTSNYESDAALQLLDYLKGEIYPTASKEYYDRGHDFYSDYKYEEALEDLHIALQYAPDDVNAIYFLARSYHRLVDYESAQLYYEMIVNDYPDSKRYKNAKSYLEEIQDTN